MSREKSAAASRPWKRKEEFQAGGRLAGISQEKTGIWDSWGNTELGKALGVRPSPPNAFPSRNSRSYGTAGSRPSSGMTSARPQRRLLLGRASQSFPKLPKASLPPPSQRREFIDGRSFPTLLLHPRARRERDPDRLFRISTFPLHGEAGKEENLPALPALGWEREWDGGAGRAAAVPYPASGMRGRDAPEPGKSFGMGRLPVLAQPGIHQGFPRDFQLGRAWTPGILWKTLGSSRVHLRSLRPLLSFPSPREFQFGG